MCLSGRRQSDDQSPLQRCSGPHSVLRTGALQTSRWCLSTAGYVPAGHTWVSLCNLSLHKHTPRRAPEPRPTRRVTLCPAGTGCIDASVRSAPRRVAGARRVARARRARGPRDVEVAARRARGTRLCRAVEVAAGAETDVFGHPEGAFSRRVSGTGVFETSIYLPL